jgi:hypothetical protein
MEIYAPIKKGGMSENKKGREWNGKEAEKNAIKDTEERYKGYRKEISKAQSTLSSAQRFYCVASHVT